MRTAFIVALIPIVLPPVAATATEEARAHDAQPAVLEAAAETTCVFSEADLPVEVPAPCDAAGDTIKVTLDDGSTIGSHVPPMGRGVAATVDQVNGTSATLSLLSEADGSVSTDLVSDAEEVLAGSGSSASGSPSKCSDYAYTFWREPTETGSKPGYKVLIESTYPWYSNAGSAPDRNAFADVQADLTRAAAVISNTSSPCDSRDLNPKPQAYQGDRSVLKADITAETVCEDYGAKDGHNVVSFGTYKNTDTLAATCHWFSGPAYIQGEKVWKLEESDVRFASNHYWVTNGQACANSFSLAGVATHEFGHVWGMGHVPEATHGNLTMSTRSARCEFTQAQLGIGDVSGIGHLYNIL